MDFSLPKDCLSKGVCAYWPNLMLWNNFLAYKKDQPLHYTSQSSRVHHLQTNVRPKVHAQAPDHNDLDWKMAIKFEPTPYGVQTLRYLKLRHCLHLDRKRVKAL